MSGRIDKYRKIAQATAEALSHLPDVECIYAHGSVATGQVDARSDVDLTCVLAERLPSLRSRRFALNSIGSGWHFADSSLDNPIWQSCDTNGLVDDVPVTVHYQTATFVNDQMAKVIELGAVATKEIPFRPYTLIGMLREALVLYDKSGCFPNWTERTQVFPDGLRTNLIAYHRSAMVGHVQDLEASVDRGLGPSVFLFHLTRASDSMISLLYAINRIYDPASKRAEQTVFPRLEIVPVDFHARWTRMLEGPFDLEGRTEGLEELSKLMVDVMSLSQD